jgi:hypothetical protein
VTCYQNNTTLQKQGKNKRKIKKNNKNLQKNKEKSLKIP